MGALVPISEPPLLAGVRLLLIGNWPAPHGGVSVHVEALHAAATRAGATVHVLDIGHGHNAGPQLFAARGAVPYATALVRALATHRPDLVHLHTNGANQKSWALLAGTGAIATPTGARLLATLHSGHGPRWLRTPARRLAGRLALAAYHHVVCVSSEIEGALTHAGLEHARLVVAPAFGREGVVPGPLPHLVRAFAKTRPTLVASVIGPGPDYGEDVLLRAFAPLDGRDGIGLVVCGPGTDDRAFHETVRRLGLRNVLLLGAVERSDALALIAASRLFVRPTLVDGDAVSVREALSLGVRVVATRVGSRPAGIVTCPPGDAAALSQALTSVLDALLIEAGPPASPPSEDGIETVLALYARSLGRS